MWGRLHLSIKRHPISKCFLFTTGTLGQIIETEKKKSGQRHLRLSHSICDLKLLQCTTNVKVLAYAFLIQSVTSLHDFKKLPIEIKFCLQRISKPRQVPELSRFQTSFPTIFS